jgi:hypothetical protein
MSCPKEMLSNYIWKMNKYYDNSKSYFCKWINFNCWYNNHTKIILNFIMWKSASYNHLKLALLFEMYFQI